jgi:hypothetical protein
MILIENLTLLKKVPNGYFRSADAIFKRGNTYFITFCHGGKDGEMSLEINGWRLKVCPCDIRDVIEKNLDFHIPKNAPVVITPCHSFYVNNKYEKELKDNNIKLHSKWKNSTAWCVYNPINIIPFRNSNENTVVDPSNKFAMIIDYKMFSRFDATNAITGRTKVKKI